MRIENLITGVDSHTAGKPTRVLTAGIPLFLGKTIREKLEYAQKHFDFLRTALVCEPRGHNAIVLAYLLPPAHQDAQFGVIFANNVGYLDMCGHGMIGVATVLAEIGMIQKSDGITKIVFDTVAGLVEAQVLIEKSQVKQVTIQNVPSFVFLEQVELKVYQVGEVVGDIIYGGNWFFLISAQQLALSISKEHISSLTSIAIQIRKSLEEYKRSKAILVNSPPFYIKIYESIPALRNHSRNFVLCPGDAYDRSPCGTGMSAQLALMYKKGEIALQEEHFGESTLGGEFGCKITATTLVGERQAIIPEVTGSAYLTALNQFIIDANDPYKFGIIL